MLETVSKKAELEEGSEAVRQILREIYRSRKISTKELSHRTQLPIPVTAAVRRELEKAGLLTRNGGASLTTNGERFVREQLGFVYPQRLICPTCNGRRVEVPNEFSSILEKLTKHLSSRPRPLPWLDQAHGTPETALLRALFMLERGDVEGRRIVFLGDDDLTSIAVGLLRAAEKIVIVDVDARLIEAVQSISAKEDLQITTLKSDLREPLPERLRHKYDVVFTDPPYTITGLTLFISRGVEALQRRTGAVVYLAFAHQSPRRMVIMQRILNRMGLAIVEQTPRFNKYIGAEMFANTTSLLRLVTSEKVKPLVTGTYLGKLYTGEITQTTRTYQCSCGQRTEVGSTENIRTIEELKTKGCSKCGKTKGFKLMSKAKSKETLRSSLILRSFEWRDFPAILEFEKQIAIKSFPEAPILDLEYHKQKLEKAIKRKTENLKVAVLNDEIVGWLWLKTEKDRNTNEKFGYVKSIFVEPSHRHQGFGTELMQAAERYFLSRGIRRTDLIVSAANYEGELFFELMAFERQHSTMRKTLGKQ